MRTIKRVIDPTSVGVLERIYNSRFVPVAGRADIERILENAGAGARGMVVGVRGGDQFAHVFNAVNQRGIVNFLDGQSGRGGRFSNDYIRYYFMRTDRSSGVFQLEGTYP